jgi:hypothetical protein
VSGRDRNPTADARWAVRYAFALVTFAAAPLEPSVASADDVPTFADREAGADPDETPRDFALMLNPLAIAAGVFGGDADFALIPRLAVSVEGDVFQLGNGGASTALGVGLLVYPMRTTFHGLWLEPRAVYARPLRERLTKFDWATNVLGAGGVAGWQWTWDYGFSMRLGVGAMRFIGGNGAPGIPVGRYGLDIVLDGSVGWLF